MNKCEHCKYICYPEYESNYSECQIFGDDDPPEEYATEDGCNCSKELLEKLLKQNEEAKMKDMEEFAEWFMQEEAKKFLHSVKPGDKVIYIVDDFEGRREREATVKEVFDDHILLDVPGVSDHILINDDFADMIREVTVFDKM